MVNTNFYVELWTDGACKGNPGIGGWGVFLRWPDGSEDKFYGGENNTTNNRMELLAVINALKSINYYEYNNVKLYTDSQYVMNGITKWIDNWKKRGWRTSSGGMVKNKDLWEILHALVNFYNISWNWIKGHSSNYGNNIADELANLGVESVRSKDV
ncbi:ribonuclease HI [Candidatus Kinetoplastibacterium desouzaii TCC079E]|uniref:Ribonuclease H n=1 Tax=Candidatus Kinetoplastidibacterium desouzai TCC079E TaxID=1208919 RepID=M1L313_9PROT|nr:ribonuclease HI [Candidatus Kinetoplastibacterium desouzaii]AGF47143.1 ribonuclease HI [Candidatus Kinetoplastibacterium desouzaii TCC079E]